MTILGLGGLLGDAASAVLVNGELKAAVEEAKLTRSWRPGELPQASIDECLRLAGSAPAQVDCVAIVRPFGHEPESTLHLRLREAFPKAEVVLVEHHHAHAASAFYMSPFDDATVLTLDQAGDFRCGARWRAQDTQLQLEKEWYFPDSLGSLYSAVSELLGYHARADEHKVQWLSVAGDDRFGGVFRSMISPAGRLDSSYFDSHRHSQGGFSTKFFAGLGIPEGPVPASLAPHVAHSLQKVVEERVSGFAGEGQNLCLAGGLFFNALLVDHLEHSGRWKNVFVQTAAGNSGTALGAVYYAWHQMRRHMRKKSGNSMLLGPSYSADEIKQVLENCKLRFQFLRSTDDILSRAVELLGDHKILAWMHGRMEFGPRALGNRSILASPLDPYSTENLNVYIKRREPFRKFAASVPAEIAGLYFEAGLNGRHIATMGHVKPEHRKTFEAAILGTDAVRVHTVTEEDNPLFHRLLHEAGKVTGLPVLYNTSFNLFGDPLVSNPRDAVRSFYSSGIDAMIVGNFLLEK